MASKSEVILEIDAHIDRLANALLSPRGVLPSGVKIERDREFIRFLAGDPDRVATDYPSEYWIRIDQSPNAEPVFQWHEMLEQEGAKQGRLTRVNLGLEDFRQSRRHFWSAVARFADILKTYKVEFLRSTFGSCLYLAVWWRIERFPDGEFAEKLDRVISAGGIPCGLEGDKRDGDLLVYWPHDVEPVIESQK